MLLNLCKSLCIHIVNGRMPGDEKGNFTYVGPNGASVADYVIVSSSIFDCIDSFLVDDRAESDHLPIICSMKCNLIQNVVIDNNANHNTIAQYRWNVNSLRVFNEGINSPYVRNELSDICNSVLPNKGSIDSSIDRICNTLYKSGIYACSAI